MIAASSNAGNRAGTSKQVLIKASMKMEVLMIINLTLGIDNDLKYFENSKNYNLQFFSSWSIYFICEQ